LRKQYGSKFHPLTEHEFQQKHDFFVNEIEKRISNTIARNEMKAMESGKEASKKLSKVLKKTQGMAEPLPMPPEPTITPEPTLEANPQFKPQPEPNLAPPQTGAEHIADFLERPLLKGNIGSSDIIQNPIARLSALKYLTGAKTAPIAGSYLGFKGLTSPTASGEIARLSFQKAGIQAIVQMAEKYPSYHDGILENPQERRSLTKEVEDDPEIPIEKKAMIQSKINRGKPLESRL
jgi:hypothetical protein